APQSRAASRASSTPTSTAISIPPGRESGSCRAWGAASRASASSTCRKVRATSHQEFVHGTIEIETGGPAQLQVVRRRRSELAGPSLARAADGIHARRFRRQAGDRDHQYVERPPALSRPFPHARRGSEAGRVAGGRFSRGAAGDGGFRDLPEAE